MKFNWKMGGAIAVVALSMGLGMSGSAAAQTATDLNCNRCVSSSDIGKKAVTQGKIGTEAVVTAKIKDNAVNSDKIADGSVAPDDLSATAQPAGIAYSSGDQDVLIAGGDTIYRTVTLNAPADGYAMVNASWVVYGLNITARCSITTGNTVETTHMVEVEEPNTALINFAAAAVRGFPVTEGNNTFNLVCYAAVGTPNIRDSSLVAMYVPGNYD